MNARTQRSWRCAAGMAMTLAAAPAFGQTGSVGIYNDTSGQTCSLSGNDPGIVTAYVVVRPGADGFRAVRFAAPVPACFGGIFLGEQVATDLFSIGNSQTGISISVGSCVQGPLHVLTVNYYRTSSTEPCCAFPVVPEPGFDAIQAVNCDGAEITFSGITSHFNANESCACTMGVPPNAPASPNPADNADGVSVGTKLSWAGLDFDGDLADFDVYLGTDSLPPLVAGHVAQPEFQPDSLHELSTYYWRIVARDLAGHETSGPTWSFTTRAFNSAPGVPEPVSPEEGVVVGYVNSTTSARLEWHVSDIDNDALTYDVYFGDTVPPPLVSSDQLYPFRGTGSLPVEKTFYWQVAAHDSHGHTTFGDVWHFSTHQFHSSIEWVPDPPAGQTNVSTSTTLRWSPFENDFGGSPSYEVYFGYFDPENKPVAIVSDNSYTPPNGLEPNHYYVWYVIAYLNGPGTQSIRWGPEWAFSTGPSPNTPSNPVPAYDTVVGNSPTLQWSISDPSGWISSFQIYLNGQVVGTTAERSWPLSNLTAGQRYWWEVKPLIGNTLYPGPSWTFKVEPTPIPPPASPIPPDNGTSALVAKLSWSASQPGAASKVFFSQSDPPALYGYTTGSTYQIAQPLTPGQRYYWRVNGSDPAAAPGPVWSFVAQSSEAPVLFSHFDAWPGEDGIRVAWKLQSDEAMDSYILYRHDDATATPTEIVHGKVTSTSGSYMDRTVKGGARYQYELMIRTTDGDVFRSPLARVTAPSLALALYQNQPNPFNPQTTIRYDLPDAAGRVRVHLGIYDVAGRLVRELVNGDQRAGRQSAVWNGRDDRGAPVASGVYFYRLSAGGKPVTRKLLLLK